MIDHPPTVAGLLARARAVIEPADADILLAHALGRARSWLFAHADDPLARGDAERFDGLLQRRIAGEPVAYLTGTRGFWTLDLAVTPATLVPRPETELLVDVALARIPAATTARLADLGTGSGAIALALAKERPRAQVVATDASAAALEVARGNAVRNGIGNVEFRQGDWLAALASETFDLIASNPPYIADGDPHLTQGDLRFEPAMALSCGVDGLNAIRTIAAGAPRSLNAGGWLLLEHGLEQGAAVRALLAQAGLVAVETVQDLEARDRVTLGKAPG
ncbi:peptide chain release factor N(5)-glutamine methyltransferase [Thermomonas paludicola]|uniref:peptide chain release factor N(5)-glutamine methyltransferase n=1 Tax=Thermomonas paludicola TaxID=2884874 RepID=UPI002113EBD8|nr:peptide chain release factor N(5)-glutamine methyltransferase [Thermomonas paludicola]